MSSQKESKIDLSIIITAHNEGILAHKTMLSVLRAAKKLDENNVSYEIIIHIDNGTPETVEYFQRYKDDKNIRIFENKFGDPSLSRNYSVEEAYGKYVSSLDGDDLCSENWLIDAYSEVNGSNTKIARVNYVLTFGGSRVILTEQKNLDREEEILHLIDSNPYAAPFMCARQLYMSVRQRENRTPYAYEDWQMIVDSIGIGAEQVVIPQTVLFYRRNLAAKDSVLTSHNSSRNTLSPTKILSFDSIKSLNVPKFAKPDQSISLNRQIGRSLKRELKKRAYHTIVYLKSFELVNQAKEAIKPTPLPVIPAWLTKEWEQINKIEKTTYPEKYDLQRMDYWYPNRNVGLSYVQFVKEINSKPDTLFFVPWLIRGGADKVFINNANEIAKSNPTWSLAVVQTNNQESKWQSLLNEGIDFVNMDEIMGDIDYDSKLRLMAMFVVQNKIKRIVIGNSKFAYDFALHYKKLIKKLDIKIYAFAFAGATSRYGRVGGYVHEDLPLIDDIVYRIITDNSPVVEELAGQHAIDKGKIYVQHQFIDGNHKNPESTDRDTIKVLWASRISAEKLPEVVREIASKLGHDFSIDAYGQLEQGYTIDSMSGLPNLNYIRPFNGVDDLPIDDYDIFLYTSNADGMPNMLLEIASKGLPIIAPDIGGIGDFIKNRETGLLIDDCYDTQAYVDVLEELRDTSLRLKLSTNAQKLLKTDFTKEKWQKGVREIFDK